MRIKSSMVFVHGVAWHEGTPGARARFFKLSCPGEPESVRVEVGLQRLSGETGVKLALAYTVCA